MITASELAGFIAAHAIWCVSDADGLIPMAAFATEDGERQLERLVLDDAAAADAVFLGSRGGCCWYVGELLSAADGTWRTVVAPEQHKGFDVELEAVRNAAHLFALLEDAVVGDAGQGLLTGPRADPKVAAIARGEAAQEEAMAFAIGWHYEYWRGLRPEAAARASGLHPLVAAMIGVEATVHEVEGGVRRRPRGLLDRAGGPGRPGRRGRPAADEVTAGPAAEVLDESLGFPRLAIRPPGSAHARVWGRSGGLARRRGRGRMSVGPGVPRSGKGERAGRNGRRENDLPP